MSSANNRQAIETNNGQNMSRYSTLLDKAVIEVEVAPLSWTVKRHG